MDRNVFLPIPPDVSTDNRNLYGGRKTGLLHLHDLQKDSTLWKKNYDEKEPLESHEPRAIAKSASKLLNRYTANALSEIEKTLRP